MIKLFTRHLYVRIWLAVLAGVAVVVLAAGWAWREAEDRRSQPLPREVTLRDPRDQLIGSGQSVRTSRPGEPLEFTITLNNGQQFVMELGPRNDRRPSPPPWLHPQTGIVDGGPAPVGNTRQGHQALLQQGEAVERADHDQRIVGGPIADHQRQIGITAPRLADLFTLAIDEEGDAVDRPAGNRLLFGDQHGHVARIGLAHGDRLDGGQFGNALARRLDVETQGRCMRLDAKGVEDFLLAGQRLAGDDDLADGETRLGEIALREGAEAAGEHADGFAHLVQRNASGQERRNHDAATDQPPMQDKGAIEAIGEFVTRCADRNRQRAGVHHPRPGEKSLALYLLQLASSTIQETRSSKLWPTWAACSGASEVGVMPGWVLISRQTSSPSSPTASL